LNAKGAEGTKDAKESKFLVSVFSSKPGPKILDPGYIEKRRNGKEGNRSG
jgi:hypothetical protein